MVRINKQICQIFNKCFTRFHSFENEKAGLTRLIEGYYGEENVSFNPRFAFSPLGTNGLTYF